MSTVRKFVLSTTMFALLMGSFLIAGPAQAATRPVITKISATEGTSAGGTKVTITGSGFTKVKSVKFGTVAGTKVRVLSKTKVTVVAPKHAVGTVDVRITTSAGTSAVRPAARFTFFSAPKVKTTSLPEGLAGARYVAALTVSGGTGPFTWKAKGLPSGLRLAPVGAITGSPAKKATSKVTFTVTDATGHKATRTITLKVPKALPKSCLDQSCSILTPNKYTVQVSANQVGDIARDADGAPTQVLLTGLDATVGQTLVIAPNAHAPSGLIVVVTAITPRGDGTVILDVTRVGPAAAYAQGTVSQRGPAVAAVAEVAPRVAPRRLGANRSKPEKKSSERRSPEVQPAPSPVELSCSGGVSSELHGLDVKPALTPSITAQWKHNILGVPEVYNGLGGLDLFQFDLDGTITVDLGIEVSGSSRCDLELPTFRSIVPAGNLGAVVLELKPTATFEVTGKVDLRTSVTFTCGAEYRRTGNRETRTSYCRATNKPLGLSADTGIDATLTAAIDARATLDDLVGVTGNLTAKLHAGYHPEQRPYAQLDGKVTFDLGACLICFWKGSPLHVTIVSATLYDRVIWSSDRAPDPVPDAGPPIITALNLPAATLGQPYSAALTTSDNRAGLWSVLEGSLPPGLELANTAIVGKATVTGSFDFTIGFTDGDGHTVTASETITVSSSGGSDGTDEGPALADLDYCRTNILQANDDGSTDQVALPFAINFLGTPYDSTYINNNGYLTFNGPSSTYTPYAILDSGSAIIAPFFADVDTRNPASALVTYGASPDGHTFCVNWIDVGYFSQHVDKTNSFQLLITDRSDQGSGDFDLTYNYGHVSWETGDFSDGTGGIGGTSARVGYSAGDGATGPAYEAPGSGTSGALLDGGSNSLRSGSHGSSVPGRYVLPIRN